MKENKKANLDKKTIKEIYKDASEIKSLANGIKELLDSVEIEGDVTPKHLLGFIDKEDLNTEDLEDITAKEILNSYLKRIQKKTEKVQRRTDPSAHFPEDYE